MSRAIYVKYCSNGACGSERRFREVSRNAARVNLKFEISQLSIVSALRNLRGVCFKLGGDEPYTFLLALVTDEFS